MRLHQPLDDVLDSESKIRVLRFFCRKGGEWNGRRVAAELAMNPVTTHKALRELHQATILDFRKVGSNFIYSLRDSHYLVQKLLRPLFQHEAGAQERLAQLLRQGFDARLWSEIVTVAIYGSVARRQERPTSDIDLLVLIKSEEAKRDVRQALDRLWEAVTNEFGNALAPYVNTVREMQQKHQRRLSVIRNILHQHQVIWGKPLEEVLRVPPT